jgi:L-glyceraldehyde 3-phosphate reductase
VSRSDEKTADVNYRKFGDTDFMVSEIGFGTADNAGLMVKGTPEHQLDCVQRALELGVNYFETSPSFGAGAAETNLGGVLKKLGKRPHIGTMVEIKPADLHDIAGAVNRELDGSLARLGIDGIDVLIIHNAPRLARDTASTYWTPLTPRDMLEDAYAGFERAKAAGKARFFGFASEKCEPAAVFPILESGQVSVMNVWFNLVNPSARRPPAGAAFGPEYQDYDGILARAAKQGVGVAVVRALDGGALTPSVVTNGAAGRHPLAGGGYTRSPDTFRPEVERAKAFAFLDNGAHTLPQAAYAFVLREAGVSTIVSGFSERSHLEDVLAKPLPALNGDELAQIDAVYARNFGLTA